MKFLTALLKWESDLLEHLRILPTSELSEIAETLRRTAQKIDAQIESRAGAKGNDQATRLYRHRREE